MESALLKSCAMIAMLLMSCCCLMGCQERDEIGDLAVVLGTALELEDDGNLQVSVELAHKTSIDGEDESLVFTVSAPDWQTAEEELSAELDKTIYWGHMVLIVLGTGFTEEQIYDYMEMFYRDQRLSPIIYTALSHMDTEDLLSATFGEATYLSQGVAERLSAESKENKEDSLTVGKYMQNIYYQGSGTQMALLSQVSDNIQLSGMVAVNEF